MKSLKAICCELAYLRQKMRSQRGSEERGKERENEEEIEKGPGQIDVNWI